jgi:hypothetical protein
MAEPFEPPNLAARLKIGRADSLLGPIFPVSADVTFVRKDGTVWRWEVSHASYEYVHGLSRVVLLVPDKMRTAVSINLENLKDPKDDGSFMVDLVLNFAKFFRNMVESRREVEVRELSIRKRRVFWDEPGADLEVGHHPPTEEEGEGGLDFEQTLLTFWLALLKFRALLVRRAGREKLEAGDHELFDLATDLLACCKAYLHYLHPLWLELNRNRKEAEEEETLRANATAKLKGCKQQMLHLRCEDDQDLD